MYWGLDPFSPDAVETCSYRFIRLSPRGNGAVNIIR